MSTVLRAEAAENFAAWNNPGPPYNTLQVNNVDFGDDDDACDEDYADVGERGESGEPTGDYVDDYEDVGWGSPEGPPEDGDIDCDVYYDDGDYDNGEDIDVGDLESQEYLEESDWYWW